MDIKPCDINGVFIIQPIRHTDSRGFFSETWNKKAFKCKNIILPDFVQDSHSFCKKEGSVRGLHFQYPPFAQSKLVRCGRGRLFDVAVDIRRESSTYGEWVGEELSFQNSKQLYIPVGFLHGFVTLEPDTEIIYKCSNYYNLESDSNVRFDDPKIGIDWPVDTSKVILSEKDAAAPHFCDFKSPFLKEPGV